MDNKNIIIGYCHMRIQRLLIISGYYNLGLENILLEDLRTIPEEIIADYPNFPTYIEDNLVDMINQWIELIDSYLFKDSYNLYTFSSCFLRNYITILENKYNNQIEVGR